MNQSTRILFLYLGLLLVPIMGLRGQCTGGVNAGPIVPLTGWQTIPCVNAGQYYTFTATAGFTYTFSFCQGGGSAPFSFDTYLTLLTNAGAVVPGVFNDNFCFPIFSEVTWVATSNATFRILISLPAPGCGSNATCGVLAYRAVPPFGPGESCVNPQIIPSLPYVNNGFTTCGSGDDFSNASACTSTYMNGDDYVFTYNSPGNECVNISLTGTTNWVGLFVLNGCPSTGGTTCIAEAEVGAGNPSLSWVSLTAPGTYYIVVSTLPPPQCTPFNINVQRCPTGRTCADPRPITSLPYNQAGLTTCGFGDDYDNTDACASTYMNGDDFVFSYTATSAQCIDVYLGNTLGWTGVFVMNGCPDNPATNCIASNTSIFGNPPLNGVTLPAPGTYYIVVSTNPSPQCTPFNIFVDTCQPPPPCGLNPPAANSCLNAPDISGYSSFCGSTDTLVYDDDITGNLSAEFCGTIENNSWFSFIADTTVVNFNISVGSCYFGNGIQARVFSTSDCINFTSVSNCFNPMSQSNGTITATGLVVGQRYYFMVDGYARDDCEYSVTWDGGPLPVTLTGFAATSKGLYTRLWWETSSEVNNDGFFVERGEPSPGGETGHLVWENIGFVNGAGNSSVMNTYEFEDSLNSGFGFYRLRQVDFDGQIQYSDVVEARLLDAVRAEFIGLFPNPATNRVRVEYSTPVAGEVRLRLLDLTGKEVLMTQWLDAEEGWHEYSIDLGGLSDGLYIVDWQAASQRQSRRLVVRH